MSAGQPDLTVGRRDCRVAAVVALISWDFSRLEVDVLDRVDASKGSLSYLCGRFAGTGQCTCQQLPYPCQVGRIRHTSAGAEAYIAGAKVLWRVAFSWWFLKICDQTAP